MSHGAGEFFGAGACCATPVTAEIPINETRTKKRNRVLWQAQARAMARILPRLASCARLLLHLAKIAVRAAPSIAAEQRDETASEQRARFEPSILQLGLNKILIFLIPHRNLEAPAFAKLTCKDARYSRRGRGDENRIVRCGVGEACRAVAIVHVDVGVSKARKPLLRGERELRAALNCDDLVREQRKHHRLVAGARANFENGLRARQLKGRRHRGDDEGLRDRLALA